jgi:alpha-mannosidase
VVVTAVKLADDESGDLVVRLHEAHGGRATARLAVSFPVDRADRCDLLERPSTTLGPAPAPDPADPAGDRLRLELRPFEIATVRLTPAG